MNRVVFVASLLGIVAVSIPAAAQGTIAGTRTAMEEARRRAEAGAHGTTTGDRRRVPSDDRVVYGNGNGRGGERRRTFIDSNGLQCEERSRVKQNGDREYDLKCREQKHNRGRGIGRGGDACVDRDRDGRCDVDWNIGRTYPATLPDMVGAILFGQGRRTDEVARWLGTGSYTARYTDHDRNRRPELVSWVDAAGALLQQWTDANGDGRADAVRIYRDGQLARVIGR